MQNRAIEIFYLLFQGVLVFQILVFGFLYFFTKKKDLLFYSLFLFFAAAYFFINAPYTFFGIPEEKVWNSAWYAYFNTPVIIIENLFYLLFLKAFFADITSDRIVSRVLRFTLWLVPFLLMLFILFTFLRVDNQLIYYTVKMLAVLPAIIIAYVLFKRKPPFAILVANGLLCTIAGTCITVFMIILRNQGIHHLFTDGYPLFFIRLGLLGDMIFYMAAILKKWHFQGKQLAVEQLQSQLAVEKLRNKISGELHDDLGGTLSGITMYSYMVNDLLHAGKYEQASQSVNIIQKSADEMTSNLHDLVWTISPGQDNLQKLIERLEEYASDMAAVKNIKFKVNVPEQTDKILLPVETRRNIYLFCKEAINNAVKYSGSNLLELVITKENNLLKISINDNGKGFDISTIKKGNGLDSMQNRADEIEGKLILFSKENEGTSVSLHYKIT
jgi:signal transduction histidine kinase